MKQHITFHEQDPLWYKQAIIYELHVKSFYDSNGDGIGDLRGVVEKLDYLQGLGITAIWLLPFYPSPQRDDGYDIADYFSINPDYGTLGDFRDVLKESHNRGLKVIIELVVNHTSDQHPWFQRARRSKPGSAWRNYYVWSDTQNKYKDARIIFKDFETSNWAWDPAAHAYYWHRFYSHQPDLNYENPLVQKEIFRVVDFWMGMGVDGLRLDAVPYLFEKEGTNCENLPSTHEFIKKLRAYMDGRYRNRMLLCEANQWPEDAASYFGVGDESNMAFHFPVMPRIFMSLWMEDRFPVIDILDQTPHLPATCQWAVFLRNHDELTLEMVTDEERDYMYRMYARDQRARINLGIRRRLAPLVGNNRRKIEMLNMLLFSLPGTPVIYYGDELGMGDNYYLGDRNGVRTPMQWSPDRNAGFSKANPQKLFLPVVIESEYHYEALNVENQESNLSSLLWWMKRVIAMRKKWKAFGSGSFEIVTSDNHRVLTFMRRHENENVLVVVNLSRFSQVVRMDLGLYNGYMPVEMFSGNVFPAVNTAPYVLTLGFHDYFWLSLNKSEKGDPVEVSHTIEMREVTNLKEFLGREGTSVIEELLPHIMKKYRWFGGKSKTIRRTSIIDYMSLDDQDHAPVLLLVEVYYTEGSSEMYLLPIAVVEQLAAELMAKTYPEAVLAHVRFGEKDGMLIDASYLESFQNNIFRMMVKRKKIKGNTYELFAYPGKYLKQSHPADSPLLPARVSKTQQSNTSIFYGDIFFLKMYRRLEAGINPELEISSFLTDNARFKNSAPFAGAIELMRRGGERITVGILQGYIPNEGDAWTFTLDALSRYFDQVLSKKDTVSSIPELPSSLRGISLSAVPLPLQELVGAQYLETAKLLGKRTGELHLAFSAARENPNFSPDPFSKLYQRSLYQAMSGLVNRTWEALAQKRLELSETIQAAAQGVLDARPAVIKRFQRIISRDISVMKIRVHGDLHLGQILYTGKDFIIIDFEGEPARSLSERRLKRSALRDIAGMLQSFYYAAHGIFYLKETIRPDDIAVLQPWADVWYRVVCGIFINAYLETVGKSVFIPENPEEFDMLLDAFVLEKAVYELWYELNNRPSWTIIPLQGIQAILNKT